MTPLKLVFPSKDVALQVASALSGVEGVEELPGDGEMWSDIIYEMVRYNIAVPTADGRLYWPETGEPVMYTLPNDTETPGYCVLGLWHAPEETIPAGLRAFMVEALPAEWA